MERKALISVVSKQSNDDNSIEVVTPGKFYKEGNYFFAVYEETEISGMEGTTTTFKIGENDFSLLRTGSTSTTMSFEKDKTSISLYNTPYGMLDLEIETKELYINISEVGVDIKLEYLLFISGQEPQKTTLKIKIHCV